MFDNKGINETPPEIDYTVYWETRDGDLIRYEDMTDNHLINAHTTHWKRQKKDYKNLKILLLAHQMCLMKLVFQCMQMVYCKK